MSLYPDKFIGRASDTIADATTWSVTGTVFSYIKRIWTWLKAFAAVMPTTGTIATTADLVSAGTVDINATVKASVNAEVDGALNTAIPGSNTANSVNDILLDKLVPVLPATAIAAATDVAAAGILKRTVTGKAVASITTANLFTISGGPIKLLALVGYITTAIQAATNVSNIRFTPTGGSITDLCGTLELNNATIRKFLYIDGTKANAMILSTDAGIIVAPLASPLMLTVGVITMTCAATTSGAITWYMVYEPMDPTSAVA